MIDMAEDRDQFNAMMQKLEIPMPESGMAVNIEEALEIAHRIGYPMMVRPSYVLGGRGMEVIYDDDMLKDYMAAAINVTPERPILMDKFLQTPWNARQTLFPMAPTPLFLRLCSISNRPASTPEIPPV